MNQHGSKSPNPVPTSDGGISVNRLVSARGMNSFVLDESGRPNAEDLDVPQHLVVENEVTFLTVKRFREMPQDGCQLTIPLGILKAGGELIHQASQRRSPFS